MYAPLLFNYWGIWLKTQETFERDLDAILAKTLKELEEDEAFQERLKPFRTPVTWDTLNTHVP